MENKVDDISSTMKDKIEEIMSYKRDSHIYNIKAYIKSTTTDDINFEIDQVFRLDIDRDFENTFTDFVNLEFRVRKQQYIQMMKHSENLTCIIEVYSWSEDTEMTDLPVFTLKKMMLLRDKKDLYKVLPPAMVDAQETEDPETEEQADQAISMSAQLTDPVVYNMGHIKLNAIYRNTTIGNVIKYSSKQFGAAACNLVMPDNSRKYVNFIIPPMHGIDTFYNFLQDSKGKGVYNKGLSYYVLDDILYVYPKYEVDIKSERCNHFYNIPMMRLQEDISGNIFKDGNWHMLVPENVEDIDNVDANLENNGNGLLVHHLDSVIDDSIETPEGFKYNVFPENTSMEYLESKRGMTKDMYSPRFERSYDNPFKVRASMAANELIDMRLRVNHLSFDVFKPGDRCEYHYDGDNNIFHTKTGLVTKVHMAMTLANATNNNTLFCLSTDIDMLVDSNVSIEETPIDEINEKPM